MKLDPVLITGCSTGIGRATAGWLAAKGWKVYATARRPESISDLKGCEILRLDVTDEDSMTAAVAHVEERHGSVGALRASLHEHRAGCTPRRISGLSARAQAYQ